MNDPQDPHAHARDRDAILRERAERLARDEGDTSRREVLAEVAIVLAGTQQIGIRAQDLRQIVPLPEITPLPAMPPWLLGITQVRGELLGVIDLAAIVGARGGRATKMAIIHGRDGLVGLAVHSVAGFRAIHTDELSSALELCAERRFLGITRDFIALLDVRSLPVASDENPSNEGKP